MENKGVEAVNLGTGKGSSVYDVLHSFEKACGKKLPYVVKPSRAGANYQELLANAMEALMTAEDKGCCIVIFCSRDCTSSAAVANELKKPEYGIRAPIFILEGGWDELRKEPSLVP